MIKLIVLKNTDVAALDGFGVLSMGNRSIHP
jgi:hypothetical protein